MTEPLPSTSFAVGTRRDQLLRSLERLIPPSPTWSMLDYPMHLNCGDGAIFAGQVAAATHLGKRVVRITDRSSYRRSVIPEDSVAVIQGGGNWGGLYGTHHRLRLRVLEETRGHPTVQMAQSIEYVDEAHREALRRKVGEHGAFTLLVRDDRSYRQALEDYDCPVHLVPDLAFALGQLPRPRPRVEVVTQARTDKEAPPGQSSDNSFDWLVAPGHSRVVLALRAAQQVNRVQRRTPALGTAPARIAMRFLADINVQRGSRLLARGRYVVTDRLHGHMLCTLMRIPHVVVGDRFGKVKALHEAWTADDPLSRYAASWSEAPALLEELRSVSS